MRGVGGPGGSERRCPPWLMGSKPAPSLAHCWTTLPTPDGRSIIATFERPVLPLPHRRLSLPRLDEILISFTCQMDTLPHLHISELFKFSNSICRITKYASRPTPKTRPDFSFTAIFRTNIILAESSGQERRKKKTTLYYLHLLILRFNLILFHKL